MDNFSLTGRQRRELEYYEEFSRSNAITEVSFEPILNKKRKPWYSYWHVYEIALQKFNQSGQKLLDFGCGIGDSSLIYAKIGYEVWGFDICPNHIAIAKNLAKKYGLNDRIHFSEKIAEHLDYPSDFFDLVIGIDILHHVEIREAISECHRVLKKNGTAVFREWIEVPILDKIRNTQFCKLFFPKSKSFGIHITEDEKKLTGESILIIKDYFPEIKIMRFAFLARLGRLFINIKKSKEIIYLLQKVDYFLFRAFPFLSRFGGEIVLILEKR